MADLNIHSVQAMSIRGHTFKNTLIPRVKKGDMLRMEFTPTEELSDLLELSNTYGVTLLWEWKDVRRQRWDVPLSILQKEFKKGREFRDSDDNDTLFVVDGLSWNVKFNEYELLYHDKSVIGLAPTCVSDKSVHLSYFKSYTNYRGVEDWNIVWEE